MKPEFIHIHATLMTYLTNTLLSFRICLFWIFHFFLRQLYFCKLYQIFDRGLRGGVQKKCVNKVNQWFQGVPVVEVDGDPRGADFFLSFGLFLWPKTASKCYKWGISGHKPPRWLQIGCTAWIKVGSQQETSGPMCRNHFSDLKLP